MSDRPAISSLELYSSLYTVGSLLEVAVVEKRREIVDYWGRDGGVDVAYGDKKV
jgi:hypothetical protein